MNIAPVFANGSAQRASQFCSTIAVLGRNALVLGNAMFRKPLCILALLALAIAAPQPSRAQDKNSGPKVVVELDKRAPASESNSKFPPTADAATRLAQVETFGKACSAVGVTKDGYRTFDKPVFLGDLFGAPITVVTIRRLAAGQEKLDREELRKRIVAILNAQTTEVSRYADWDEWVGEGIVATVQF